jgi:hypothetical protein
MLEVRISSISLGRDVYAFESCRRTKHSWADYGVIRRLIHLHVKVGRKRKKDASASASLFQSTERVTYLLNVCPGLLNVDCLLQSSEVECIFLFRQGVAAALLARSFPEFIATRMTSRLRT